MIPDWNTNHVLIADLLSQRHPDLARELRTVLDAHDIPLTEVLGTKDIWIRDAAPVQVGDGRFVQFRYQPDYLRNGHEHLITGPDVFRKLEFAGQPTASDIILDGGNIVGTEQDAILTDKVFQENPGRNRKELEQEIRALLGVERLILIPQEPADDIGHADGMVRFLDENTVAMNDYATADPRFSKRLVRALESHGLKLVRLPWHPEGGRRQGIASAAGNYANYLRVGKLIVVPGYEKSADAIACERLQRSCPDATVVPLDCRKLAREGGVLNCITWTIRLPESGANRPCL